MSKYLFRGSYTPAGAAGVLNEGGTGRAAAAEVAAGGEDEEVLRNYDFNWTLGLGVDKGNWGLDIALEESEVNSGYLPFNGNTDEPIAYMSAWLSW